MPRNDGVLTCWLSKILAWSAILLWNIIFLFFFLWRFLVGFDWFVLAQALCLKSPDRRAVTDADCDQQRFGHHVLSTLSSFLSSKQGGAPSPTLCLGFRRSSVLAASRIRSLPELANFEQWQPGFEDNDVWNLWQLTAVSTLWHKRQARKAYFVLLLPDRYWERDRQAWSRETVKKRSVWVQDVRI